MPITTTVIIGAGQSGLAFSQRLSQLSIDHVLLERGRVANAWEKERWDSLRLLTPNWQTRLPGYGYKGKQPDEFMPARDVATFLNAYASRIDAPIESETTVLSVTRLARGYMVETDRGPWFCQSLVIASGACNIAHVPKLAEGLTGGVKSVDLLSYRNPDQLDEGNVLIVGASASGAQLAHEIQASGRQVYLSVGEHVRLPRHYRGRDICWWMDKTGLMDTYYTQVDDLKRARKVASLQLMGSPERQNIDLNALRRSGVQCLGRLQMMRGEEALLSGGLANHCALADLKMNRLLDSVDQWIEDQGMVGAFDDPQKPEPTEVDADAPLSLHLGKANIKTVIWATGYRPDYSWLTLPVLDRKGAFRHDGGVSIDLPGLYIMGLPFMRRRKSSYIDGVGQDAFDLANHLKANLNLKAA